MYSPYVDWFVRDLPEKEATNADKDGTSDLFWEALAEMRLKLEKGVTFNVTYKS